MMAATPKLIEYEEAHRTAFEAAAAFRPPYFGPDFRAHNWVVEAVRSAHMDGQRFAQGLPRIERSAAAGQQNNYRKERPTPAQPKAVTDAIKLLKSAAAQLEAHNANYDERTSDEFIGRLKDVAKALKDTVPNGYAQGEGGAS